MDNIINRSFGLNIFIMKILLLYPLKRKYSLVYKVILIAIYFLLTLPVPVLGFLYFILDERATMAELSESAFVLTELGCYSVKLLPFLTNGDKILSCIHYFESVNLDALRENHKNIIENAIYICRRNSRVFLISIIGSTTFWICKPLLLTHTTLPSSIWLPFEPTSKPIIFYLTYFVMSIVTAYPALCIAVVDPLLAGLASHAASQVTILKDNLQHLSKYADEQLGIYFLDKQFKHTIIYNKIKECVEHHNAILKFVDMYQNCFSMVVFSQFVGGIFSIGLCCMRLTLFEPSNLNFFITVSYICIISAQVYFYCYYGAELFEQNNTLSDAVYSGTWYDYDTKSKTALLIIMERSKRPLIITAGKLIDLSLDTFIMIVRRSFSVIAVLKNYQ